MDMNAAHLLGSLLSAGSLSFLFLRVLIEWRRELRSPVRSGVEN